ncbi:IS5 family transposase [Xanthocytophaga flava]|nr:IS5 family transposase [Xanthocytophaga flavus]
MGILSKDMIEKWILPQLPIGTRGFETRVPLIEIVECILYRLKTGCQWRELPTKEFFSRNALHWNTVYYYFSKWSKADCWKKVWLHILANNLKYLDLSSIELDGSHTRCKNGGDAVGYQGRKAAKTTSALFVSDNQGVMLAMSTPQEGQHHDLFQIQLLFEQICLLLKQAGINLKGLFLNADPAFDSVEFDIACQKEDIIANVKPNPRNSMGQNAATENKKAYQTRTHIFDDELYRDRTVIEHANAWLDGFKALLIRFECSINNWMSLHFIAFSVIFLRKIKQKTKV